MCFGDPSGIAGERYGFMVDPFMSERSRNRDQISNDPLTLPEGGHHAKKTGEGGGGGGEEANENSSDCPQFQQD